MVLHKCFAANRRGGFMNLPAVCAMASCSAMGGTTLTECAWECIGQDCDRRSLALPAKLVP